MRPLLAKELTSFMRRFENFKDAQFRSLDVISANEISLVYAAQDNARAFDWITVRLNFTGVVDAKLLKANKMSMIDMSDGICLSAFENNFAFASSTCYNISDVKNSACYIIAQSLKYKEDSF